MNCKQGDLAIVVESACSNEGKIVMCVEFLGEISSLLPDSTIRKELAWRTAPRIPDWFGCLSDVTCDSQLRPIRDNDKEDESFRWAPSPTQKELT